MVQDDVGVGLDGVRLGTFLRAFTFGHARQLDALLGRAVERAWKAGAGPGGRLVIRLRKGSANSQKGIKRFCEELIARVDRAGGPARCCCAPTAGWNTKLERAGWQHSIGVRNNRKVRQAVEAIPEHNWQRIDYPDDGEAQIAETVYGGRRPARSPGRALARLAALRGSDQPHRRHRNRRGRAPRPRRRRTGHRRPQRPGRWRTSPPATSTPTAPGQPWPRSPTTCSGGRNCSDCPTRPSAPRARRRLLTVPGRLTSHVRGWPLHLPARWPWHSDYTRATDRIRALPAA